MDPRETPLEGVKEPLVIVDQKLGVEPADDVELGHRFVDVTGGDLDRLFDEILNRLGLD